MKKPIVFVAVCCIGVGLYFSFVYRPPETGTGRGTRVIPGVQFVFTRDENAADHYAKACESMSRRAADDRDLKSFTSQERKWFMLGTSCRQVSWYPEHFKPVTDPTESLPPLKYLRGLGRLMAAEGRAAEKRGDVKRALDIYRRIAVLGWHTDSQEELLLQSLVSIAIEAIAYDQLIRYYRESGNSAEARRYEGFKQLLRRRSEELTKFGHVESLADCSRLKDVALSHKSALFRKEACGILAFYCITRSPSLRQDTAAVLTRVSREDADPRVRDTARNLIPYVLAQKILPAASRPGATDQIGPRARPTRAQTEGRESHRRNAAFHWIRGC